MRCMSVDLPEPEAPMIAVSSPRRMSTLTPGEGVDGGGTLAEAAVQIGGCDDRGLGHATSMEHAVARRHGGCPLGVVRVAPGGGGRV